MLYIYRQEGSCSVLHRRYKMTQKEKLIYAISTMRSVASSLRRDAHDFDCTFPNNSAKRLEEAVDKCSKGLR